MAESNTLKRVVHDNDPFAELERIMGTGANAPVRDNAEPDPFQLDLERELLGEIADEQAEQAAPQPALRFRRPDDEAPASEHRYSGQAQAPQWQREDVAASEPAYAAHAAPAREGEIDLAAEMDAIFAEEFADEPLSSGHAEPAASFAPAVDADQAAWEEDAVAFDAADDELPLEAAEDEAAEDFHPQEEALYEAAEPAADSAGDGLADVDMDFGDLSAELETASQDWYREQRAEVAFGDAGQSLPVVPEAVQDEPALSLEDELVMLLGNTAPERAYGRANYAPAAANQWQAPAAFTAAAETPAPESDAAAAYDAQAELAAGEAAIDLGLEDELALDHEQFEPAHAEYRGPAEAATDAVDVFTAPAAEPVPVETAPVDFDLDIVDVPEGQVAVDDDLDLPQLPVEEERSAAEPFDELEAEFAEMFRIREPEQADAAQAAGADEGQALDDYYFNEALGAGATGLAYGRATPTAAQAAYGAPAGGDAYDDDDGLSDGADMPPAVAASRGMPRRNMVIAGAVGALALLGVVGVFAFSGGDRGDAPALVRADEQPMKVRPENPGGATVPNQDSQAYQRAAGGAGDTLPAQKELVTTAEEPVNVAAKTEAEAPLPQPQPEANPPSASANALPGVNVGEKIEDRVPVEQEAAGTGLNEDLVAVTPRRVRTMVVRPDGTLVPREEIAAAPAAAAPQATPAAPRAATPNAQPATPNVQAAAPAPQQTGSTPAPQAAAPQQPAQPQPAAPAPAPQQQQQQVAAAPQAPRTQPEAPAAPAAASGEWSMQIASQPTAEGAQATYQDLARRYGEVLSGRGVNIVRADIQGKGTYYRVRIPSATRNDAIALCERYKAAGGSCFVSK